MRDAGNKISAFLRKNVIEEAKGREEARSFS
jgi:hypothetical protein